MEAKEIVILLTNKGYVAIEGAEIFDLWTNKSLKEIYEELKLRYSAYKIHLGSKDCIDYQLAVEVANQYLTNCNQLERIKPQNINHKNYNNMKHLTFNTETVATLAKVTAGFTTQKLSGVFHLTLQTGADVLQFGANTVAKTEASVLTKLKLYNESKEELIKIRQERSKGYQEMVIQAPKNLYTSSQAIGEKLKGLIANRKVNPINQ